MKKFFRFVLIVLGIIVLGIIVLGIIEPKDILITRSTVIAAPKEVVWEQIVKFKNWPHWSPWYEMEPNVEMTYSGDDGMTGSGYHWKGDKTGEGEMKNTGMKDGELDWSLKIVKPWESEATGFFKLTDTTGGDIKVTWTYMSHMSFPKNAMGAFFNMDKMLGGQFARGLELMKKYCETEAAAMPKADIKEMDFAAHMYAGIRKEINNGMESMTKFYMDNAGVVAKAVGAKITGPMTGLYWTWDTVKHTTDMAIVFPVADTAKPIKGVSYFYLPASKAVVNAMKGPYSGMKNAHIALSNYIAQKGKQHLMVLEEYLNDPGTEKDSTKLMTNIIYLIK